MISKFGKVRDTWFMKAILGLTALSFMSLFGISGYVNSRKNKPVIKVDNIVVYQDEITLLFEKEHQSMKKFMGDDFNFSDEMRTNIMQLLVKKELEKAIITKTADDLNVHVSDNLIRKIIFSQPQFMGPDYKFDHSRLRQALSAANMSEQQYINMLRLDVERQDLIYTPVKGFNIPNIMLKYMSLIEQQTRKFSYIMVRPEDIKIDRKISKDEINQYYSDFSANFMDPEQRMATMLIVPYQDIQAKIMPTDEAIEEYYQTNKANFETAETRDILQMLFSDENDAKKALAELNGGKDFVKVAKELAHQSESDTRLGFTAKGNLIFEVSEDVFNAKLGGVVGPIKSDLGYHVMKVNGIHAGSKKDIKTAKAEIIKALREEMSYEQTYEVMKEIEDKIGAGEVLENIAKDLGVKVYNNINIHEPMPGVQEEPPLTTGIVDWNEVISTAFMYNKGETSQIIEGDGGFVMLRVDNVIEAHAKDINDVKREIEILWAQSEKNAIMQEIINDVTHDLNEGDDIAKVATRYSLRLNTTGFMNRSETFAGISNADMLDLFQDEINTPRIITMGDVRLIVETTDMSKSKGNLSESEAKAIKTQVYNTLFGEYSEALLNDYASEYDVRVKYRLLGLAD